MIVNLNDDDFMSFVEPVLLVHHEVLIVFACNFTQKLEQMIYSLNNKCRFQFVLANRRI